MGWSWEIPQKLFQNDAGGRCVRILGTTRNGFGGAVALVHLEHLQAESAAQLAAELESACGVLVACAVWV
jgi:hypothetical protein